MKKNLILATMILTLMSIFSGCRQDNHNTAMFRGNLQRTGIYETGNKIPLGELKWIYRAEFDSLSSPIVSKDTIYVSSAGGYLIALEADTGRKIWIFKREKWGGSSPAVSNGVVYVGSMDNYVYAVDIKTGLEKWKFKTGDYIFSSPAVSEGLVYFGSYDGFFYALNANTGQEKWKFKTQGAGFLAPGREPATDYAMKGAIHSSTAIFKDIVYFGSYDSYLYALDANTGQEVWKFESGDAIFNSTPAVTAAVIYFGSQNGYLYAVDNNGQEKWEFNTNDFLTVPPQAKQIWILWISSPAIANGIAYFGVSYQWREHLFDDGSDNRLNYLFAVDMVTGQMKWKTQTTGGVPTISSNIIYFGTDEGHVFALNAKTGQEIWKFKADSAITSEIVVIDGIAYFCTKDGYLYALQ